MTDTKYYDIHEIQVIKNKYHTSKDNNNILTKNIEKLSDILIFIETIIPNVLSDNRYNNNPRILHAHSTFSQNLKDDKKNWKSVSKNSEKLYYRGQAKKYSAIPTLFREGDYYTKEKFIFDNACKDNPELMKSSLNNFDRLSIMQHHGYPTRLLDITNNAMSSLFFACSEQDSDVSIYIFDTNNNDMVNKKYKRVVYSNGDTASVISAISQLSYEDQKSLYKKCIECESESEYLKYNDNFEPIRHLYQSIRKEEPSFTDDILNPHVVIPIETDPRISSQGGAFIVPGLAFNNDELDKDNIIQQITDLSLKYNHTSKPSNPIRIFIKKEYTQQMLTELSTVGIDEGSIYLDMNHKADAFKRKLKN